MGNQVFHMEFQHSHLPTIDMNIDDPIYEYEGIDDEDDVFFAEIRRQILLLTADDEDYQETKVINSVAAGASKPGSSRAVENLSSSLQHGSYFSWSESQNTNSVPTWLANLWRIGNGTGVFIPHITKSRRRQRPGRIKKRNVYRPIETTIMNKQNPLRDQQAGN